MPSPADYLRSLAPDELSEGPPDTPDSDVWAGLKGLKRLAQTKVLRELPDIVATIGTGMAGQAAGGWQGLTKLATGQGLDAAVKAIEDTQKQVTYLPREEGGQEGLQAIGGAIEPIAKLAKEKLADPAGERWPAIGAALVAAPEILPGPKGIKAAAGGAGKAARAAKGAERVVGATEGAAAATGAADAGNEATRAALRAINAADKDGVAIPGGQNGRNEAFQRAREAAQAQLESGNAFEHAETAAHGAVRVPNGPQPLSTPIPGSTEALQRERVRAAALRGENTPAQWVAAADAEPAPLLERLQAARDAEAAHRQSPTPENKARVQATLAALRADERTGAAVFSRDDVPGVERGAGVFAGEDWIEGAPFRGRTLSERLQAVGEARRAHEAEATSENAERLYAAERDLREHRENRAAQRAAVLREEPDTGAAPPGWWTPHLEQRLGEVDMGEWLGARRNEATGGAVTDETIDARARVLTQRLVGADSPEYGNAAAYIRRRLMGEPAAGTWQTPLAELAAERQRHAQAGTLTPELNAVFAQRRRELEALGQRSNVLSPEQDAKLAEIDQAGWLTGTHPTSNAGAIEMRARVLALRVLTGNEDRATFNAVVAELQRRMRGEPAAPARPPLRLAGQDYSALDASRQPPLRHQKELPGTARRVDPGWEHQKLIPGLEPLSEAEGRAQAARRLGIKTRILRRGDPEMNRESVLSFYEAGRDNPELFQYGVDPRRTGEVGRHASLEDYADVYGRRANDPISIDREGSEPDWENIDVEIEPEKMRHGRGEAMRDRYGDYIEEKKKHEAGDVPVYDERGNVKKTVIGFTEDELPKKEKYVAVGGELMREGGRYGGDVKRRMVESEGGEVMRDERGNIKYDQEHDPEAYEQRYEEARQEAYDNAEPEEETIRMRTRKGGNLDVTDVGGGDEWGVYAGSNAKGKDASGALLYQTLLNYAANAGEKIGGSSLTDINALRVLSNANSNFARTGINPRGLRGTASGDLPPLSDAGYSRRAHDIFAEGPEIWRSESDEALKRAQGGGGKPERMAFDPELGFTLDGVPATAGELKAAFPEMSPGVGRTGVGMKTLMRSAVFDWLRDATPDEAARVAKGWGKKHGPLFSMAGVGLTLQDVLREQEQEQTQ